MDDLIDRQQAINVIERMRAYIGHNMERAVGAAFIEILDEVGEDIGRLPSIQFATDTNVGTKLGTNLAQLGTDCISRQAAIDALLAWMNDPEDDRDSAFDVLKQLPSAQPEIIVCEDCKWRISENRKTTSLWLPCRALVTPDKFSCIYAESREVTE